MSSSILYSYYIPCHFECVNRKQSVATLVAPVTILSPVAVVGNSALMMATIWRNQLLIRTLSYILLCSWAFTDLCTGLLTQPFHIADELFCVLNSEEEKMKHSFLA